MGLEFLIQGTSENPATVRLSGRLTLGPQLRQFGQQMTNLISTRRPSGIVLDVEGLSEVDSAGLGELVILYTAAGENACRICLLRPSERVLRLLEQTKLTALFPHFDTAASARAWLAG